MDSPENKQGAKITRIGKYEVIDELGRGGMGVVYRGIDESIGREVAIKTLTQGYMSDGEMLARFYDEGRRTGRLNHPNIVTVYALGDDNGIPYIVMERVEGNPLDRLLRSEMGLSMAERLKIVEDVCSALGYAHRNNVIHRDVKPANIFVQPDGNVKLLDFGIARLEKQDTNLNHTRTGSVVGTVPYMAPERLQGSTVDGRADIFSIGVVLYQLVAGQLPFVGEDFALMQRILNDPHPPLNTKVQGYPAALEQIIDRSLAKSPEDRYSTADEMAADLNIVITELRLEQVRQLLPEARHLIEVQDFTRARSVLQQLLKIQPKNTDARELLAEIQRHFTLRQREERIQQLRQQAEEALTEKRFDQSLALVKEGLELDTANQDLAKLQEKVLREKDKQEQIVGYLRQADTARRVGDYKSAIAAAQKALKADKSNSKIVALCNLLNKEAEHAQRQAQAKTLLDMARSELGARRFVDALALLNEIEQVDPTNPELPLLLRDANSGQEQAARREVIAKLEDEVAMASTYEQLQQLAQSIQGAMASMPAETALFRLNAGVDRQIKEYEDRRLADDTVRACRDLRPREALEVVREARLRVPGDERLLSLERLLDERLRRQSVDERLDGYLAQAREYLKTSRYGEAVRILELCQAEGIVTEEALSLLEFARHEDAEQSRMSLMRDNLAHARSLVRDGAWDKAVEFLEEGLKQTDDPALRLLLEQASAGRDSLRQQIETVLESARKLVKADKQAKAIQLLQVQPPAVLHSDRVQVALTVLQEEQQQAVFRMIGRTYAVLETDLPAGTRLMRRLVAASGNSALAGAVADAFRSRARALADRVLAEAMSKCKAMLRNRDKTGAGDLAQTVSAMVEFASPQVSVDWRKIVDEIARPGLLGRLRG
jgi:serine/threonine protein kinase